MLVVALEHALAAPLCSARLAAAGARVIKVEREEGDFARQYDDVVKGESTYFVWVNQGKESVVLDLKDADDCAPLHNILEHADIFIQNLAPGAVARLGLGSAELTRCYPRLIACNISGYGETGEYSNMRAYDMLVQCETGLASVTGGPGEPGRVGISVCDIAAGLTAYQLILEALIARWAGLLRFPRCSCRSSPVGARPSERFPFILGAASSRDRYFLEACSRTESFPRPLATDYRRPRTGTGSCRPGVSSG